jgi:hypothetical protein
LIVFTKNSVAGLPFNRSFFNKTIGFIMIVNRETRLALIGVEKFGLFGLVMFGKNVLPNMVSLQAC